jgi:hypothetical protein
MMLLIFHASFLVSNKMYYIAESNPCLGHVNMLNHRIKSTFHRIDYGRFPNADFSGKVEIINDLKNYPFFLIPTFIIKLGVTGGIT